MHEQFKWLQVARTDGVGPVSFHSLYAKYSNPDYAIEHLKKLNKKVPTQDDICNEIRLTHQHGARIIFCEDDDYPKNLRQIRDAPPFLVVKGKFNPNSLFISIVGSRNSDAASNKIAFSLAQDLVSHNVCVVSGMARGIDRHAHLGAIQNTIGVIACGIDQIYPQENKDLYEKVFENGAIITEAPFGTKPVAQLFHARNRIVAGISFGTVVVQATPNSGSLITAQYAADYSREVFAVPGCPLDPRSYGPNHLIKNGAVLVQDSDDVLEQLSGSVEYEAEEQPTFYRVNEPESEYDVPNNSQTGHNLLQHISFTPIGIDELQSQIKLPINILRQKLVELELDDKIRHLPGDKVALVS